MRRKLTGATVAALLTFGGGGAAYAVATKHYRADLSGGQEVPVRVTGASGKVKLSLDGDGTALRYQLIVKDLDNVWMAHIHAGAPGVNGPIVAWLLPNAAPAPTSSIAGRSNGLLVQGELTAADLTGQLAGQPLSALVEMIEAGDAYVNIHTNDFLGAPNSGPGDFPGGELRGQVHDHR